MDICACIHAFLAVFICAVMLSAGVSDWRSREVSDTHWALIGGVGVLCGTVCSLISGCDVPACIMAMSAQALFLFSVLYDTRIPGIIPEGISLAIAMCLIVCGDHSVFPASFSVVMCALFHLAYCLGIVRGGADAKCLMALSLAMPCYPEPLFGLNTDVPGMILELFVPSVSVLFTASVMSVISVMVLCFRRNRGRRFRGCSHGYMMPVEEVCGAFVWPSEDLVDGRLVRQVSEDKWDVCRRFEKAGIQEIYVTPMVPFIVPMAVSVILILTVGCPFLSVLC